MTLGLDSSDYKDKTQLIANSTIIRRSNNPNLSMPCVLELELELELTNTNPNDTEANAAGRSGNARALRKQSKCGVYHECLIRLLC